MFRYLLIVLAIWVGIMVFRRLYLQKQNQPASKQLPEQNMLRCSHCGIHFLESEAVKDNQKIYCCEIHKLADRK